MKRRWVYSPHSGGRKVPSLVQEKTRARILAYAGKLYAGKFKGNHATDSQNPQ